MTQTGRDRGVRVELLGPFRVEVGGVPVASDAWPGRRAADLVQLLALSEPHRLTRDEVIEALWPTLDASAGAANLRKAAHHARQAIGDPEALVLKGGQVSLFPSEAVETDVAVFEAAAASALRDGHAAARSDAVSAYRSGLLPESPYEDWTQEPRDRLRRLCADVLRQGKDWERLVEIDPTDERAYRALMERDLAAGSRPAAIRWYGRLRNALRRELGVPPSEETQRLYDRCIAGLGVAEDEFVGRQVEVARATGALRTGGDVGSRALVVRGPAGIGKSAFCREVGRIAEAEGWAVVSVSATEVGVPYAPLVDAHEAVLGRDPSVIGSLGQKAQGVFSRLSAADAPPDGPPPTRHQVIGALRRLLLAAGDGSPVLFTVDDAHLADEATIDVLGHLGNAGRDSLMTVLAFRHEASPEALARSVARLGRSGKTIEIDLGPLDDEDSSALVASGAPSPRSRDAVVRIIELAEGNPFLTLELARSAFTGVPALVGSARDAVTSRLLDLDDATEARLRRLALAADDLDPAAVVALLGTTEAEAFEFLDEALDSGVLVVSGAHYRFRHDLIRQLLVDGLAPHQRLAGHRDAAERLTLAGAAPGIIASHWLAAGDPDRAEGLLLAAARDAMAIGAYADALADLDTLLGHRPDNADAQCMRAEALDARGDSAAPAAYALAATTVGGPQADDLKAKQALAAIKLGDAPGGLSVLEGLDPVSPDGRLAQALAWAGAAALGFADPKNGTEKAAEARRDAMRAGDTDAAAIASWAHAAAAHARGELRESVIADLFETASLPTLAVSVFDGQLCITQRLLYGARPYSDVIGFADALVQEAERLGAARGIAFGVTIRGEAKLLAGDLDEAEADLRAGVRLHRDIAAATGEAFATQRLAEVWLARGDQAKAAELLDEALAIARESDVGFHLLDRIYGARVTAAPDAHSAHAALEEAEEAVRGPIETCPGCRITLAVPAAIAAARAGDVERLDTWEPAAEYLADVVMRLPAWSAALEEVHGYRAQLEGDEDAARAHFEAAATGFGESGQPLDQARCEALSARYPA